MSRGNRLALVALAAVVAVVGFVLARPDDERGDAPAPAAEEQSPGKRTGEGVDAGRGADTGGRADTGGHPAPGFQRVVIRDGKPLGGVKRVSARAGEVVRLAVASDIPDEIHVHGYDLTKRTRPGAPARFRFLADIEGVFEVEAHDAGHVEVAKVVVEPS